MPDTRARHPELIELGERPSIVAQRCADCGRVAFPPDPYGCEQCGAHVDRLERVPVDADGRIHAVATVHRHHRPHPPTPFTVATIVLDSGITLKGVLTGDGAAARIGDRVQGVLVDSHVPDDEDGDDGTRLVDLHFEVVTGP